MDLRDSENATFMFVLSHPNFSTLSAGYLGCYGIKLGWGSMWMKAVLILDPPVIAWPMKNLFTFVTTNWNFFIGHAATGGSKMNTEWKLHFRNPQGSLSNAMYLVSLEPAGP